MYKPVFHLLLFATLLVCSGCAVLASTPYYKASTKEPAETSSDLGGALYLRFGGRNSVTVTRDEVEVAVRSNGTGTYHILAVGPVLPVIPLFGMAPDAAPPAAYLEIYLRPKTGNITFNPMSVVVKNLNGREFSPDSYIYGSGGAFMFYNGDRITKESRDIAVAKDRQSCFVLEFPIEDSPDLNFDMEVKGVKNDGKGISAPGFHFARGKAVYLFWGGRDRFCSGKR